MIGLVAGVLVMVAELVVAPEECDAFVEMVASSVEASRSFEGNLQFDILVDEAKPGVVMFIEKWVSPEAQQAYMAWRRDNGDLDLLQRYLVAPPKFTAYRQATD